MCRKLSISAIFIVYSILVIEGQVIPTTGFPTVVNNRVNLNRALHSIQEDWNGFIWLGTDEGLIRFDGTDTRIYTKSNSDSTLLHTRVFDILVDHENKELWVSTASGISRFDPATEKSIHYIADFKDPNSLADNYVREMYMDQDRNIWVGSYNQGLNLFRRETNDFEHFVLELPAIDSIQHHHPNINLSRLNSITAISQDRLNPEIYWLGSPQGMLRFDRQRGVITWVYLESNSPKNQLLMQTITEIEAIDQRILIGTEGLAFVYNSNSGSIDEILKESGSDNKSLRYISHFEKLADTAVWISYTNGLVSYDLQNAKVDTILKDVPDDGKHYGIRLIDQKGRAWSRSSGKTLLYDPTHQIAKNYELDTNFAGTIAVMEQINDSTILMLNSRSDFVHEFDLSTLKWTSFKMKVDLDLAGVEWKDIILQNSGPILLLSKNGLYELDLPNHSLINRRLDLPFDGSHLYQGLLDQNGNLWIATLRVGMYKLNLNSGKLTHYLDELNSKYSSSLYTWITDLMMDKKGNIWIRLARSYAVYDQKKDSFQIIPHHEMGDKTFRYVRDFHETEAGDVWVVSMDEGIGRVDYRNLENGIIEKFTTDNGLRSNTIAYSQLDNEGMMWLMTKDGLSTFDVQSKEILNFGWERGITKTKQFMVTSDLMIVLPTAKGGIQIVPKDNLLINQVIPSPFITSVNIRDNVHFENGNQFLHQPLNINDGRDYLSFNFSALGYANPKEFAYRLSDVDDDWVATNELKSTSYSNLSPGHYTFDLRARLTGGEWSEPISQPIYLAPEWWETWWAKTLLIGVIGFGVFSFYRWRIGEVTQREEEKTAYQKKINDMEMQALRAQMNPHFLFNSLNSIQRYIIKNEKLLASEYLENFARLMRLILQNSRSSTIPVSDEIEALKLYMELEKLRVNEKFEYQIEMDPSVNPYNIEMPPLILQPFVENAIWHGLQPKKDDGRILIQLNQENETLCINIEDNGVGRLASRKASKPNASKHKSVGMKITQDRLDIFNDSNEVSAKVEVVDLYDPEGNAQGTRIQFRIPV